MEIIETDFETVKEMYLFFDSEKLLVKEEDHMLYNTGTVVNMHSLRQLLGKTEDDKDSQIRHFGMDIAEQLEMLRGRTLDVEKKAQDPRPAPVSTAV